MIKFVLEETMERIKDWVVVGDKLFVTDVSVSPFDDDTRRQALYKD